MKYILFLVAFLLGLKMLPAQTTMLLDSCFDAASPSVMDSIQNDITLSGVDFDTFTDSADVNDAVPVQIHIIRQTNGTGGLSIAQVTNALNTLNTLFSPANITFFQCSAIHYIDDDNYYYFNLGRGHHNQVTLGNSFDVANVLNIYFVNTLLFDVSLPYEICGVSNFPSPNGTSGNDRVIIKNACALNPSTLAHEVGHYFNLLHTHSAYPVAEKVARFGGCSNCATTGDYLCDTPADPGLNANNYNATTCAYTGTTTDVCGNTFAPDVMNLMGYGDKFCRNHFTTQQYARMDYANRYLRAYLSCNSSPCASNYTFNSTMTITNVHYEAMNSIVCNAPVDISYGFLKFDAGGYVQLSEGFKTINNGSSYFKAYIDGCGGARTAQTQTSPTPTTQMPLLSKETSLQAYPNPFQSSITVSYQLPENEKVSLALYDLQGAKVKDLLTETLKMAGEHQAEFEIVGLSSGVYILRLQTSKTVKVMKLVKE